MKKKIGIGSINWPVGSIPDRVYAQCGSVLGSGGSCADRETGTTL
ncbi:hypothetical protein HMPREF9470_01577 [[Clostridium] citroniae WAL-19142]|uniref:Uncharacterized protein n=1 Tax=[Clostridium] citroniae WAL-19142 TaxID=742734 RepID=A0A0J9C9I5_9FIRM|nr:hypothetical protein HMPREF9470_01577 [[Clostridium] citroniae WAL-19142]